MDDDGAVQEEDILEEIDLSDKEEDFLVEEINDVELDGYSGDEEDVTSDSEDDSNCLLKFTKHNGSVFVVDCGPGGSNLVVSGGEDEVAHVWDVITGEVLFSCTGHKDSVTCAAFNADSSLVATGDMSGIVQVWKVETKEKIWDFETGDLEWIQWHPVAPVLMAGTQDGQTWMWQIPRGQNFKTFPSHGSCVSSGSFSPDRKTAALGYEDGTVKIIDLKSFEAIHSIKGNDAHAGSISDLHFNIDGSLLATSSTDGSMKLISTSSGKVSATYDCGTKNDEEGSESVESVRFSPTFHMLATACLDGSLQIWDYKSGCLRHKCKHEQGLTKVAWDAVHFGGARVYTGCLDGRCRAWDARSGQLLNTFLGCRDHVYDLKVTSNGERLVAASADGSVCIFKIHEKDDDPQR